ncbi:MAG: hypothetical protein L6Q57_01715 [Alphaproteobacteria bacterium]|nr:hypothetical protein [Alphaproteobacteria bacterium]
MAKELLIEQSRISYLDLPAIMGGAVLAIAISLVLANFGAAIGLSLPHEYHAEGKEAWAGIIAVGLYGIWVQVLAAITGGYLAGRMRRPIAGSQDHEREIRDGAHGLLVWATGMVAVAIAWGFSAALMSLTNEPDVAMSQKTPDTLQMERTATIIFAFITSSTSLVAAVASWWAATMGGEHRDNAIDHSHYVSFRK